MSDAMRSWKAIASSGAAKVKNYVAQQDSAYRSSLANGNEGRQTWREWAVSTGQKINAKRKQISGWQQSTDERVALFPGWAARRYPKPSNHSSQDRFEVDVFVSGFASVHQPPESAGRSQRTFMKLAKGFAALPKLEAQAGPGSSNLASTTLTPSTEELLSTAHLPPRPSDIPDNVDIESLESEFRKAYNDASTQETPSPSPSRSSYASSLDSTSPVLNNVQKLHSNLEARLQPFWSQVLPRRAVRVYLFASPLGTPDHETKTFKRDDEILGQEPIITRDLITGPDGSFQGLFRISWEDLCQHPHALHIAFGEHSHEHEFIVAAELLAPPSTPTSASSSQVDVSALTSSQSRLEPVSQASIRVSLTHSPIRLLSDIDDTVKHSNVLGGTREIFHNVFVKELEDLIIPEIGEWYTQLWQSGVRFHYVSNGPFAMLPILAEFFPIARLPPGSIKLRSYAGYSVFSGLLSAPSSRKRAGVVELLDSFPDSGFILVGDSGEQDLELYAELARERPGQILGIFIRQVDGIDLIDDPTGKGVALDMSSPPVRQASTPTHTGQNPYVLPYTPRSPPARRSTAPSFPASTFGNQLTAEPGELKETLTSQPAPVAPMMTGPSYPNNTSFPSWPEAEKKRQDLQSRVFRARSQIPPYIPLRIFKSPKECKEVYDILGDKRR